MQRTQRSTYLKMNPLRTALPFLAALAWSASAAATVCTEDSDCAEGYFCAKGASSPGCDASGPCPEPDIVEEEAGTCEAAPVPCETNADCGEYLSCVSSSDGVCWITADGDTGCEDTDPNAPKYCALAAIECSTDADCPRDFECVERGGACPEIACVDGDDQCPPCEPAKYKACQPKVIECEKNEDCPAEWSCSSIQTGDEPVSDGATDVGSPQPFSSPPDQSTVARQCFPDAWGGTGFASDANRDVTHQEDSGAGPGESASSSSSSSGGCSMTPGVVGATPWLASLLLLVPFARRRRRA